MYQSKTKEIDLEIAIERYLTGHPQNNDERSPRQATPSRDDVVREEIAASEPTASGSLRNDDAPLEGFTYISANPKDYDAQYAVDRKQLVAFLQESQPEQLAELQKQNDWELKLLTRLDRVIKKDGILRVLRKGLQVDQCSFTFLYEWPTAVATAEARRRFKLNRWSIMRQVRFDPDNQAPSVDMVAFLNGLPIVTIELKNAWTNQNARYHATKQYRERDPKKPLFQFGRCIVHFAADTEEVYMTTKLVGKGTNFLPFNKGNGDGRGNPVNPTGHRTAYLWKDVLQPASLAQIIQHYVRFAKEKKTHKIDKWQLFFPRYHQRDVVRQLVTHASMNGPGQTYLIQHSAGSGKSNSITWAAFQLIEAYPQNPTAAGDRDPDKKLFDSVIVVTDRRLLDKQIRDNILDFSQVSGIVAHSDKSSTLREAMEGGKRIIITTIQKFPFIVNEISNMSDKRFAVIIDEAHSSQSGSAHDKMNAALGGRSDASSATVLPSGESVGLADEESDPTSYQDQIVKVIGERKQRSNVSYLAFTATPKPITLEKFGVQQPDGSFKPFHLYSMRQAIEEGFILDVLANYTTYKSYYEVNKQIEDNPEYEVKSAQKKLRKFVEGHKETIAAKAEIMVEHFLQQVVRPKKLKGQARAMVVTNNIVSAIRYYQAIRALIRERNLNFEALVAFSDKKTVDGIEHTENSLNGPGVKDIREAFDGEKDAPNGKPYRILVVANKFLTGFDQKKLTAMYVDKRLQGVLAVQALSRLNRANARLGKRTEDLVVLDFYNTVEEIQSAFEPFYTATSLSGSTDLNMLHDLKDHLDGVGVYALEEVQTFVKTFFAGADTGDLGALLGQPVQRFSVDLDIDENDRKDFKIKAKQFVKVYGQMASIATFDVVAWEELYWFLKFLVPLLKIESTGPEMDDLLETVDLSTYGLERTRINASIVLDEGESVVDPQNPNPRSVHEDGDKDELDNILQAFNERWFSDWGASSEDARVKFLSLIETVEADPRFEAQFEQTTDKGNKRLLLEKMLQQAVLKSRKQDHANHIDSMKFYKLFAQEEGFKGSLMEAMMRYFEGL